VYERTYSRKKTDGTNEVWGETVARVARGNLELVYGPFSGWSDKVLDEFDRLTFYMNKFAILPAGRHLWASGVKGRQYLFNCHVAGFEGEFSKHFSFTSLRLFEGGGVGANYSMKYLERFGAPKRRLQVHIVCDPSHADYQEMLDAGLLSKEFDSDWAGAREVEDTREGWAGELVDLLDTYMTEDRVVHEDRVYDVTNVRKKGSRLKSSGGTASGPAPFARMMLDVEDTMNDAHRLGVITPIHAMEIDHATAQAVVAGGNRRSARMAMVHWKDPYIFDFLACKQDTGKHWTTNISVEIDQEFIDALADAGRTAPVQVFVDHDGNYVRDDDGSNPGTQGLVLKEEMRTVGGHPDHEHAVAVHKAVVTGMLTNGEPGYWNSDLSNKGEPNLVICTNPCGEIALEAWENCNLGHVNLDAFAPRVDEDGRLRKPDILGMLEAHRLVTRFLIRATYGDVNDEGQADKLARNRRIGVGHLGVQGFFAKRGQRYSDVPKDATARRLLRELYETVRYEARAYAFELRIPEPVKVTTVAPTGSIAKLPGVPEGIHPIMFRFYNQRIRFSLADSDQAAKVEEYRAQGLVVERDIYDRSGNTAVVVFPTKARLVEEVEALGYDADVVEASDEISLVDMLAFQEMYQTEYADNAVSYTVNVPMQKHQQEAVLKDAYAQTPAPTPDYVQTVGDTLLAALPKLKGTTLMVNGSRPQAPYEKITKVEYDLAQFTLTSDGVDEDCATGACPVK
jgi:adenosylcobalamin-dependent ribonucleoside-triphosphate reductase